MPVATTRHARTALAVLLALFVTLVVPTVPAHAGADAGAESEFVQAINRERASQGLPALSVSGDLVSVARRHSVRMADDGGIYHNSNLPNEVSGWQKLGENVGRGPSVSAIHSGFMSSSSHRANILDSEFTQVGVGVEKRGAEIWVTQVFRRPSGASSQPEPEPEPEPAPEPEPEPEPQATSQAASSSAPSGDPAPAAEPETTPESTPEPVVASEPLPPVDPEVDRLLATMTRVAAVDA